MRLSADAHVSVLLIEAGGDENAVPFAYIPKLAPLLVGTTIDWDYRTVPQAHALAFMPNSRGPILGGKVLGGTSTGNL